MTRIAAALGDAEGAGGYAAGCRDAGLRWRTVIRTLRGYGSPPAVLVLVAEAAVRSEGWQVARARARLRLRLRR